MTRDFLEANPPAVVSGSTDALARILTEQNDYLADIALYLRRQNADVLTTAVVKGASQQTNAITDLNSHEVFFEIGGKPVQIYRLFAFSTYVNKVAMSLLSLANVNDGIPFTAGVALDFPFHTNSVHLMVSTLAGTSCVINGPANSTNGGFFLYGFTVPDYSRFQGSSRS